ncbi:Fe(3+)-hydroxamate ABC transporter permease FhuB [Arhodomonas sp. AD133]|uniref:Fe(3+)-hydroxamate ABC transporter permease FhuB n=1 Tax=Arhodomonas sp. AD133 TaxID=3415009 RepID=UPI003EBF6418
MPAKTAPLITPMRVCALLGLPLLALAVAQQPESGVLAGLEALFAPSGMEQLVLHYAWWPRLVMALLGGGGLALAGGIMQQVLRNPLASPTTLGVASGANLALMAATLMAPGLLTFGREWVALAGGGLAAGLVFLLAARRGLTPVVVVLAGLVVNLYLSAVATVLLLFNHESLTGLLIWSAGSLVQNGWDDVAFLWPRVALGGIAAALLLRPLGILELDDASARSLGVSLGTVRFAGLGLAVFVTASVVSVLGVVGFIGLAAPNIVRLAGARRLAPRLLWATLLGAILLATADLLLQHFSGLLAALIPTGAITGTLGAPLLLWLIPRLRLQKDRPTTTTMPSLVRPRGNALPLATGLCAALLVAAGVAALWGQGLSGWYWVAPDQWAILQWRVPRLIGAAGSGVMLAIAGTLLQRLSANPMASPEVLGISSGSAIALMAAIFLLPAPDSVMLVGIGTAGAFAALLVMIALNYRNGFAPARLLLTGVAITSLFDTVRSLVLVGGDPRSQEVIAWIAGSTYYVDVTSAAVVAAIAVALGLAAAPFGRWLDILPLGTAISRALGINLRRARLSLLLLVALLTACATLVVGPLSFVGLLAPHMARLLGFSRARAHLLGSALTGALLMVLADWLGRTLLFPNEIPAGVVASLLGGAYFMWLLRRV